MGTEYLWRSWLFRWWSRRTPPLQDGGAGGGGGGDGGGGKKSFADLERDIAGFATKAREGKLKIEDLTGGTFTISNGGVYGSLLSTPILNPPQSGILGMHKIMPRPVAIDGKVEVRPMMYLALSYDHRAVDGKEAVTFLIKVKECIEDPTKLTLDF